MIWTIAKREYFSVVKKKSFWISTLSFPVLIGIIAFISGFSSSQTEELFTAQQDLEAGTHITIVDETGLINKSELPEDFVFEENVDQAVEELKNNQSILSVIYYPQEITEGTQEIKIFSQYDSILTVQRYNELAVNLLKQNVLETLTDEQTQILNADFDVSVTAYEAGEKVDTDLESFVVPIIAVVIYFVLITFGSSFMLSSVSEEKESRMIEIILSSIRPRTLILGKLIGLFGVVLTQVLLLVVLGVGAIAAFNIALPIDFSQIPLDPGVVLLSVVYIVIALLIIFNLMVGAGAGVPTLKEAQGLSSIFIMLSLIPLYMVTFILADPNSQFSVIISHVPLLGPITVLFRNVVTDLPTVEIITTLLSLVVQLIVSFFIAFKVFELGALQFNDSISMRGLFGKKR